MKYFSFFQYLFKMDKNIKMQKGTKKVGLLPQKT